MNVVTTEETLLTRMSYDLKLHGLRAVVWSLGGCLLVTAEKAGEAGRWPSVLEPQGQAR